MNPTISVALIVKNEERFLPDCLGSIKGVADEIVIVDTGSTDGTKAVAEKFGAKIYDLPWNDDFSAARNFAITKCTSDWVLSIDADETLVGDSVKLLKKSVSQSKFNGYYVQMTDEKTLNTHQIIRLFKRDPGSKFVGKIHETIKMEIPNVAYSTIRLIHRGYDKEGDMQSRTQKHLRNLQILQKSLASDPTNVDLLFHTGLEHEESGNIDEAIIFYKKAHDLAPGLGSPIIFRSLAMALQKIERFEDSLKLLTEGIKRFPEYSDLHYLSGSTLQRLGKDEQAIKFFVKCVEMGSPPLNFPNMGGVSDFLALRGIGLSLLNLGRREQAKQVLEDALKFMPGDKFTIDILGQLS